MNTSISTDYMQLSISERIQLVEEIWDSIVAESPENIELSPAQKVELHRRVTEYQENPSIGVSWEHVRAKLFHNQN